MGILDKVKTWASDAKEEVKRFKSKNFMEAVTAGCAMVAFADGVIKPEEKAKMAGFIQRNEALSVFDMSQVIKSFEKNVNNFEFDLHIGKGEALKTISKIKKIRTKQGCSCVSAVLSGLRTAILTRTKKSCQ